MRLWLKTPAARLFLLLGSAGALVGCDTAARIYVTNNSGAALHLRHANTGLEGNPPKITTIPDQKGREFGFHAVVLDGVVTLRRVQCEYVYSFPPTPWYRGFNEPAMPIQIERDLRLYLKPRGSKPAPLEALPPLQKDGFPITPTKTCPA